MVAAITRIITPRMYLRRHTMDDLDHLVRLNSDPDVQRYLTNVIPSRDQIEAELRYAIEEYSIEAFDFNEAPGRLAAFLRENGAFVGRFSLRAHGLWASLSVGYRLLPEYWGQGWATEGTRALIDVGFAMPGIELIRAQTMFVNSGSRRVMEKSGLRYRWTFHPHFDDPLPGTELGEVEYVITKEEWLASRSG